MRSGRAVNVYRMACGDSSGATRCYVRRIVSTMVSRRNGYESDIESEEKDPIRSHFDYPVSK